MKKPMGANCDGIVCLLGCAALIPGVKQKVVSKVAFAPPSPSGFVRKDGVIFLSRGNGEQLRLPKCVKPFEDSDLTISVEFIAMPNHGNSGTTDCVYIKSPTATATLIYSHGNSTDIGFMFGHYLAMATVLDVNVVGYEYTGYGDSSGGQSQAPAPSEENLYRNINTVYFHLVHRLRVPPGKIVLYGQSLGTAPSILLAASRSVGGLILHSGMKSGLTVIRKGYQKVPWFDVFPNLENIKGVTCPVMFIHGANDVEVPLSHGEALYDACPSNVKERWFISGAGHNDIEVKQGLTYYDKVLGFLKKASMVSPNATCRPCPWRITAATPTTTTDSDCETEVSLSGSEDCDVRLRPPKPSASLQTKAEVELRNTSRSSVCQSSPNGASPERPPNQSGGSAALNGKRSSDLNLFECRLAS